MSLSVNFFSIQRSITSIKSQVYNYFIGFDEATLQIDVVSSIIISSRLCGMKLLNFQKCRIIEPF